MKLHFKHQKFQADAARAVCDVFSGQPRLTSSYMMDKGISRDVRLTEEKDFTGFGNARIVPQLSDGIILENIQRIQRSQQIAPSPELAGRYNLTVEMETGVGKTAKKSAISFTIPRSLPRLTALLPTAPSMS